MLVIGVTDIQSANAITSPNCTVFHRVLPEFDGHKVLAVTWHAQSCWLADACRIVIYCILFQACLLVSGTSSYSEHVLFFLSMSSPSKSMKSISSSNYKSEQSAVGCLALACTTLAMQYPFCYVTTSPSCTVSWPTAELGWSLFQSQPSSADVSCTAHELLLSGQHV